MLKMVDGTGIIGVDMICPLGVSTPQPPNYDRVELEGTGMLVLPNSLDAPLERLELGGKTEQVQTTGKNLFDIKRASVFENYVTTEKLTSIDISAAIVFDVKKNTNYCLSVTEKAKKPTVNLNIANDTLRKSIFNEAKIYETVNSLDSGKIYIGFSGGETDSNIQKLFKEYFNIQLEEGTNRTPYEPYTGGKPSPSPEYPQEIKSVGKWNEEKQKYEVTVKINNANLLNEEDFFDMGNWKSYQYHMDLAPSTKYTFSRKDNSGINSGLFLSIKETAEGTWSQIINSNSASSCKQKVTFTTNESGKIYFLIQNNESVNPKDFLGYAQLEVGTIATQHMKYTEQPLTLTSDRPITKWDKLVEQGGEIGWLCGSEILQFTDAEGFKFFHNAQNKAVVNVLKAIDPDYSDSFSVNNSYCTHFINNIQAYYDSGDTCSFTLSTRDGNCLYFKFGSTSDISDLEKFEKWILEKRPVVIYKTKDLQFIPLPQSEQNAIRALKTYYPTTVITADGGELDPDIKVTYRKEI